MNATIEKIGQITVEHKSTNIKEKYNGTDYFRQLVKWLNNRAEYLNDNKSKLQLIGEFNKIYKT